MSIPVRVLIVDDSEDDTLLLIDELQNNGFDPTYLRVDTQKTMSAALREQQWDIIIADYRMPDFSGPAALQVLHDSGLDIPLILVSGTAEDHIGIDMMQAGAQDFILKHNLSRLAPAVTRELREANFRRLRMRAEDAARISAENYRTIFDYAPAAIAAYDRNAIILQVNPAFEQLFCFTAEQVIGRHVWETFGLHENEEKTRDTLARVFTGELIRNVEYEDVCADGTSLYVIVNITPVYNEQGEITMALAMITDITERKLAEQRERALEANKREFYRRTILAATGGKLFISEPEEIEQIAGQPIASWQIASIEDVNTIRDALITFSQQMGMDESQVFNFAGCAVEALANAYKHADKGNSSLHKLADNLMFVVSDRGSGIEALALPDVALTKGYSTAISLGMGYKVMIEFADKVYLSTSPEGTVVAIEMALHPKPSSKDDFLEKLSGW